ncbi:MAG: VWA domain-containing protein [Bacteroidales bacterium]|nr:VWA domain-containing protein [Bacteroidales bacterium]
MKRFFKTLAVFGAAACLYGCGGGTADQEQPKFDEERPGPGVSVGSGGGGGTIAGIPSDDQAEPNPEIEDIEINAVIPNVQCQATVEGSDVIIRMTMTGVKDENATDPDDMWLTLLGTGEPGQNIWLEVDGKPKGIDVYNTSEDEEDENVGIVQTDFVFLVDNSGSMGEEADAVARDIVGWAQVLNQSLDVRFGIVGYDGCIHGAVDLASYEVLSSYLNNRGNTGTSRTRGYAGDNALALEAVAPSYGSACQSESGVAALRFADENFTFRPGANIVYVNFTDEANYTFGGTDYSVTYVEEHWAPSQGTIHSVISDPNLRPVSESEYYEDPTRMSTATGGTILITDSSFSGVSLSDLPVTGAMQNSYVIRFTNVDELFDGQLHEIRITIVSADGSVKAEKVFFIKFELA